MADERLNIIVSADDKASGKLGFLNVTLGNLAARGIASVVGGLADLTKGLIGVAKGSIDLAADFEEQIAILSTAVSDTTITMGDLSNVALQVGADTTLVGVSATEAADAMTGLYKAGLTTNDIFGDMQGYMTGTAELSGALRAAVDLQAASSLDLAEASDIVAVAMATFGLTASEATGIADSFVQSADASVAEVEDLAAALVNAGPTAAAFGWTLQETNTALAILSTRGIQGAEAGTALKSMMTNMLRPTDKVTEALSALNVSLYDQDGQMRALPDIIGQLSGSMSGLTEEQRNQYVQTIAGTYGMKAMQTLMAEGVDGWNAMTQATNEASSAQEIATVRTDTHKGKLEALEGTIETVKIGLGDALMQGFTPLIETLGELISEHGPDMMEVFEALGQELSELAGEYLPLLVEWIENIDWDEVIDTVKNDLIPAIRDLIGFLEMLFTAFGRVYDFFTDGKADKAIQDFVDGIADAMPDWLIPGSPTPLELGIRGVTSAMQDMGNAAGPAMATAQTQYMNVYGGIQLNGVQNQQGLLAELQGMM